MQFEVHDQNGQGTGRFIELSDNVFGISPSHHAMYLSVKQYLAHQRQGTHKAKEKSEVSGSTRKLKRQKGTGGARAGSIKSPVFVGGGHVFGPKPRDYSEKMNKKVRALARASALSYKVKNNELIVIEDLHFDQPQTKAYVKVLKNLGVENQKTLLLTDKVEQNVWLSLRNIPRTSLATLNTLNTYSILNCKTLIISESALKGFGGQ